MFFKRARNGYHYQQRRNAAFIPRTVLTLIRLPIAAAGAGMGVTAYMHYKVSEATKDMVPDWMKKSFESANKYFESMDFNGTVDEAQGQLVETVEKLLENKKKPEANKVKAVKEDEEKKYDIPVVHQNKLDDNQLMGLTKKLIEIRNLLKSVDTSTSALTLPSIVVVGSQSSGKSSVLEAIVGHEFLPKGSNMVTRRPIELTLIHTPDTDKEYSEFPQLQLGKITSFEKVQKTLTDLNLAVSDEECVSHSPIELKIYSPYVPDLTMVDLPGFIQVATKNQPRALKQKIIDLCEKYIAEPNVILAVSAADVDLANSEALRASRRADPLGLRTIGVITKMDLVEPALGVSMLNNQDFPLSLGYIGVVNKPGTGKSAAMIRSENAFFKKSPEYDPSQVGSTTLRRRLMEVLESHMGRSLHHIADAVETELDDARYQFKVLYNDLRITPESYVAECMDALKHKFKDFTKQFDKPSVRESIRIMLEKRMIDIISDLYWKDDRIAALPKDCTNEENGLWDARVSQASAQLTRSGVGKASVQLIVDSIGSKLDEITSVEPWSFHESARRQVIQHATDLLRSKFHVTVAQVENTIKPYKFEVEASELEWKDGQKRTIESLQNQLNESQQNLQGIKASIGRRKLRHAIKYVNYLDDALKTNPNLEVPEAPFPAPIIAQARQAIHSQAEISIVNQRLAAVKSRQCSTLQNKACCPEVFLSVVSEKLASTAVMFIYIELLNDFFYQLPREIDSKMYYSLGKQEILQFCKENPGIEQHLKVQERKNTLELVASKLREINRK
ncbi:dynamin-like GTPase mgm1 [Terramyces sp. JEL0728]|nr:dynamin-like GTPase mgm1 [Terramyces sp. JEL0728]